MASCLAGAAESAAREVHLSRQANNYVDITTVPLTAPLTALRVTRVVRRWKPPPLYAAELPPQPLDVGGRDVQVSARQLLLKLSEQTLESAPSPNRLPHHRRLVRGEINEYMFAHEDMIHRAVSVTAGVTAEMWLPHRR